MENIKNTMKFTNIQKQSEEKLNQIISDIEKLNLPNVKQNLFQLQRLIIELESENEILRNEAKKNRKLQDSIMDGFVFVNMQGVIIETNDSFQQITGYNADELKTLTYFDLTPENWHAFEDNIVNTQILVRGYSDVYKKEYIKKDGTIIPVEFRTYLIQDDNGNNEGMWAIVRDKSKRKAAENVLFEKEQQLKLILENIPGMFFALDKEGVFILSEGQQLASIEKKPNEVIGKSVFDLFRNHPEIISCIKRAFNGEVVVNENLIENIFFHVTYSPTRDRLGEINGVIGVSIDITQRKKAEELLQISENLQPTTSCSILAGLMLYFLIYCPKSKNWILLSLMAITFIKPQFHILKLC